MLIAWSMFVMGWAAPRIGDALPGPRSWLLVLVDRVAPWMIVPTLLLLTLAAARRRVVEVGATGVALLALVGLYAPHYVPTSLPEGAGATLTVMTFNVLYSNEDVPALVALLQDERPDVIALQEVMPGLAERLGKRVNDLYPYRFVADPNPYGTTALLSRVPLLDPESVDLGADRPAAVAEFVVEGRRIRVASAHLLPFGLQHWPLEEYPRIIGLRGREQAAQAQRLLDHLTRPGADGVVLGCDCNATESTRTIRILATRLESAPRVAGGRSEATLPAGARRARGPLLIDHLLYDGALVPLVAYHPASSGGSDHRPIVVRFRLEP